MASLKFHEFIPKSYLYLRNGYKFSIFKKDLVAGLTVGIIALPLAMAFAIASNVSPERGLYTAIIAGFLISLLGGSRIQIGGPTGAFVGVVYGIIQRTGYQGLCISMVIAAIILLLLGIFRIGSWIKYVPSPLVTGFTTGIAVIIFSTQIKDFFGLQMGTPPADFIEKWASYCQAFPTFDPSTVSLAAGTLGIILLIRRFSPWLPWGISAIVLATAVCMLFHLPVETIQSRFGEIPRSLPFPSFPSLFILADRFKEIFVDGITIAFLGAIESLLSAVIGDGMIGGRHRSNCELIAQGVANFGSVIFGGIPATGAIARTATNVKTGAQTPVAGMIHALVLLLILYCLAPIVSKIPLAALASVLVMVSWNMSEIGHFTRLLKAPQGDRLILLTAFFLTVFVDITVAISAGMILASFLFMKRMSQLSKAVSFSQIFQENDVDFPEKMDPNDISKKVVPKGVEVYEIQGPFFFGAANMLRDLLNTISLVPKVFILRMRFVPMIDVSGMYGIEEFYTQCQKRGIVLFLSGVHGQIKQELKNFGLINSIGEQRIFPTIDAAFAKAEEIISCSEG
ncbi:MAG TPA: sulfate permease [Chlamydiales bacterium]|jgi:SulP family sulfate permease|nr:sulfate permease [Chlamydiales bacterium]